MSQSPKPSPQELVLLGFPSSPDARSVTIWCPRCAQEHTHGRGTGSRVAHCFGAQPGYYVVDMGEPGARRLLGRIRVARRRAALPT